MEVDGGEGLDPSPGDFVDICFQKHNMGVFDAPLLKFGGKLATRSAPVGKVVNDNKLIGVGLQGLLDFLERGNFAYSTGHGENGEGKSVR